MPIEIVSPVNRVWLDLSLAQQAVWLDAKVTGASVYQLGGWARVGAPLEEAAVRQSVRLLMARHDALRLRVDDDLPRQWLEEAGEPPVTVRDLDVSGDSDPDAAFQAHVDHAFATPMPLGEEPLFRIELLRAGPNLHYVLWRFHHLIADSMSVSITLAHWFDAYEALTGAAPRELAPPSSYLGTIAADAAYLESAAYHQNLAYWAERFDPLPPQLIADLDLKRGDDLPGRVPPAGWELTGEAYARFEAVARESGGSVQRSLFALFAVTLGRRYGQTDVVSGVALHRRDLANRTALGMMAGVIAVRCDFDPFWTLGECVQAFSEQMDADLRHQRLPVDVLSRALGLSGTGRTGLFEVAMSYIPAMRGQGESPLEGLPVTTGTVATREASPVSLHVEEREAGKGVVVSVAVNTDFLHAGEAATLAALLERACDRFVNEPDARFEDLDLVTERERAFVEQCNRTGIGFEQGTLDGLFAAQAARTPLAVAIVGVNGAEMSYAELDARSSHLARQLIAGGVRSESVVGVRMRRSAETIVALLAILKAGGAYLPLDPAYPAERLEYMASDADALLVIDSLEVFDAPPTAELPPLLAHADPSRLAYVIYTSGTTGLPKGVAVEHRAAVNLAFARRAGHDPLGVGDRVLAAISVGFDVSIGQLLLPLLSGATVMIADEVKTMEAADLWDLLAERRVTHINSVPSFLEAVLPNAPRAETLALKRLMLGGEALSGSLVDRIQSALPHVEVVNMYGPTETCIDATFHVATEADRAATTLPIGKPLANYRAYVLDSLLQPVGIGVSGELYIGGAGVARGYVNAPELTAERFLPDPFADYPGARMYRSGDRARWRPDGGLEFLGRGDAQVKIRGFRVEPGEIAATLLGHPDVAHAVVVPRADKPGAAVRLTAYVVPRVGADGPDTAMLRAYLAQSLPDYMVPSAFVPLAALPLNRNGKLDLAALPAPELEPGETVAPRTATEAVVAALFAEVLGIAQCGANDHFFELGGHSLLAATLVSRLRAHGWTVPLRAIFETPTVEMLARRIDASLPLAPVEAAIVLGPRPDAIPLSLSQERIWFVDRLQGDSSYNIPLAFHLRGRLDVAAAERAFEGIVARHEVLRTRIVLRGGEPVQEIHGDARVPTRRVDLSALDEKARDLTLREHLAEFAAARFDLASDPPLRMLLLTLAPEHHVLAAVMHHVAFDGWSAGVFLREFSELYTALAEGRTSASPPPSIQYADFALWQRRQDHAGNLAFWLEEMRDAPSHLELPRNPTEEKTTRRSGTLPLRLDAELQAALPRLAREHNTSLFMVLHAAFALLLARWSGQDDVVVGTVTANRGRAEFEPLIGCFVNTLPLRTRFVEGESFASLLHRVKSADLAAFAHQELPFEQLVAALDLERSLEHTPLFQAMFVLQNTPLAAAPLPSLKLEPIQIEAETAKFDLTLSLAEDAEGITGTLEYAADRFSAKQMERLGEAFQHLLRAAVADPSRDAMRLDILDPGESALVAREWNRTEARFADGTLDGLFSAQAAWTPNALAVIDVDGSCLTYAALDAQSTRLARRLAARGVQPGAVVGVRMERSAATVLALLAVLKAGAVYLPLDPAYPAERLTYMAADAGAMLVLESLEEWSDAAEAELPVLSDPRRLAYVIYTSGTTGVPKGVAVAHAAAVNLAFARRAAHDPLGPGDRVLAAISVGFDVSIGQLLLPLLCGATVVIAAELKSMAPAAFWAFLIERDVTHINSVPSFFDSVLDATPPSDTLALKRLMLGGEGLSGALVARIAKALPSTEIVNMYGPTEVCIDATFHVATIEDHALAVLPIGHPLPNYRAYVLDRRMQPVGIGVAGELYLGGVGLAQGYVNSPDLTAERFVPDPFSPDGGGKLYRTGDRALRRDDGALEFLGRVDNQVKIRGFRVEPGEIEERLRRHPGVREAAVVPQSIEGGARLIAYYTSEAEIAPDTLRTALAATLPEYMVPAAWMRLDRLPLSLNGKLDRKALPAPGMDAFAARGYEAPVGEIERSMAELWAELLGVERVGRHDNFFELGGHSLLAVTLMERMAAQGLPGDVRGLFTAPTVAGLIAASRLNAEEPPIPANGIEEGCASITPEMLPLVALTQEQIDGIVVNVPGGAANVQDIYPLSPLQEGILFQHRMTAKGDPYLTPFLMSFDHRARLDSFLLAMERVVARHDVLRTAMRWEALDTPVQVVLRQAALPVEEMEIDASAGDGAAHLLSRFDPGHVRLDLTQAPLLRVAFSRDAANGRWLLLLLTHHLILDHTSLDVLMGELRTLMSDPDAPLSAAVPYRKFIALAVNGPTEAEHAAFFRRMLGDMDEPTAPYGLLDTQIAGDTTESRLALEPALARGLRERARALGVTSASLFHVAWALVLGHVSGRTDVVFGTVLFGRMRSGAGGGAMVGMTINTLPLRLRLDGAGAAESVLATHRLLADLMAHEHAPLALAQRASGVAPPVPLFSSLFNYRYGAEADAGTAWPGVAMVHAAERTNYPLAMAVDDSGGGFTLTALAQAGPYAAQACRYLRHALGELLAMLDHEPKSKIEDLEVLPAGERASLIKGETGTHPYAGTLDGLFHAQAEATPNAIAVIGVDGTELTYAELDARSTRLARRLAAILPDGVAEPVVGVRMTRSAETVIAMLAILKAGAVYLPLDPAYPAERLEYMAADAGATMVLDALAVLERGEDGETEPPELTGSRLAYIIYTSGTTGLPKGVAVEHRAAVNLAFARRAGHDPLGVGDRVLAAISVGFDVSIGQLLLPLLSGATVVIAGEMKTMGAAAFWSLLAERRVTHINSVPSFFDSVLHAAPVAETLALKRLMLGGEALPGSLVKRIWSALPGLEIVNMYGPTEACIDATCHVAMAADVKAAVLPIGRPLRNYRAYILNSRMQPVGAGVEGELYLGGAGLARGYVNAPELTAGRFVADPFSSAPDGRLYRTGDLARRRDDGAIEFLGRRDGQVKVRGFRVELGEIEARLRRQPGVRDAAVLATVSHDGTRLIAYYTGEASVSVELLRTGLAAALPDYMVPSAFVKLDVLPLTANGKLDRKALPEPGEDALTARAYEAPVGTDEETIAAIWAGLLKLERVGRRDNFFELGGHSLLAMTLIERMRQHGLPCDVRALFTTPTIAGLAASLDSAIPQMAAPVNGVGLGETRITPEMLPLATLTQTLTWEQIDGIVAGVPGGAANVQDIYPLAPLQQGILLQHRMSVEGDPYLSPLLLGFAERESLDRFVDALRRLVARHDVLRTAMVWEGLREPLQVVLRHASLPVEEVALDPASPLDAETELLARFDPRRFRLDLTKAPLLRVAVAWDTAAGRWLLLLLTHHLVLDHTSLEILVGELRTLIESPGVELPPAPPYRNFIAQTLQEPVGEGHEAFFQRMLGDVEEPTAPYGMLDLQGGTPAAVEGRLTLDPALTAAIRDRARALGVTPASLFHLAWAAVLGHVSERDDVVFGTVLFGRMRSAEGADRVVGMFINTLPLRIALGELGVAASVLDTHRLLADLMAHEHAPLALAQRASAVPPPAPLFSSLFNYRYNAAEDHPSAWPGVEVLRASESTNYPLAMAVEDSPSDFTLIALAQPGADATRVCGYLEQTLRELVTALEHAPGTPVAALEVLPAAERELMVEHFNRTELPFKAGTLDALFAEQAARTPDALAVVSLDGQAIGYAELDARTTLLARSLLARGVEPGSVVGVRMERSAETVIALLAILKVGGVYLPLDPSYPAERLDYMIADAGAALVLETADLPVYDDPLPQLPELPDAERLAYVIYTSGTTGLPKGVAVTHRAAVNLAYARRAAHDPLGPGDRVLAAASVGFDVSIGQLLLPLLAGATVVIAGEVKMAGASEFWAMLADRGVTHINSVPSFFASIVDAAPPAGTLALKRLMLGGETLTGALVARLQTALPGVEIVNMYGPTEACIDATYYIARTVDHGPTGLPIGRPLPNYRAYVLDGKRRPVGIGAAGELYLGGAGLAEGYVNSPGLTAERFVADPFAIGSRLYRTGDRVRRAVDGAIEFLGRMDTQVKIRGFRVEPNEVAAKLRQQPGVREASVVSRTVDGATRLVAYMTGDTPTPRALRSALALALPDYMVPSAFVRLEQMPLSLNGKLDHRALPAPGQEAYPVDLYEAPMGAAEEMMAALWSDALVLERVGRHDNFFELGGDSLGAMRLVTAIEGAFAIKLPVRMLFQHPTVEALSAAILTLDGPKAASRNLVPIQPGGENPRLFVVHGLSGHIFHYMPLVRALGPQQPIYGLQATGLEEGEGPEGTIEEMAAQYVDAVRGVQPSGPYHLLGYSAGGLLAFAMAQLLADRGDTVEFLALLDTSTPNPAMERTVSDEALMLDLAGSLGLADMVHGIVPVPTIHQMVERAREAGRLPAGFAASHVERMAGVFRHMIRICPDYPLQRWDGPLLFLKARRKAGDEPAPDWSPYVAGPLRVVDLECDHLEMIGPATAKAVAEIVARELTAAGTVSYEHAMAVSSL